MTIVSHAAPYGWHVWHVVVCIQQKLKKTIVVPYSKAYLSYLYPLGHWPRERERAYGPVYITVLHGLPLESMENKLVWLQKRKEKENIIYAIGWWKLINVSLLCT